MFLNRLKKLFIVLSSLKMSAAFFRYGVLAGAEHRSVLNEDFRTVVDIGANKGQFSLACYRWCPIARIIAFEPLLGPANVFKAIFKSNNNVELHLVAVGPEVTRSLMHISAREDSSSLLPIGKIQVENFSGTNEIGKIEIFVSPLSEYLRADDISSPAMLKLDVQGFEMEALKGCESLLDRFDSIYCECSFIELYSGQKLAYEVIQWLYCRNFRLDGVFNTSYDSGGSPVQADFSFKKFYALQE